MEHDLQKKQKQELELRIWFQAENQGRRQKLRAEHRKE